MLLSRLAHRLRARPGDCIEPFPQTYLVTVVPCHVPHSAECATTYVLPQGPYPDAVMTAAVVRWT
ncbi:hypothetical protein ACIBK9_14065 [Nonomuraea sp. NPDC050227]|uniref:hypothetical protein n=1 Tax=Nonomuraea sp. NPDC050227 TaxID=3364360 RepID=UPI0037B97563